MEWMILPLKRYGEISGRSRRREFWMFFLFATLAGIGAEIIDDLLGYGSAFGVVGAHSFGVGTTSNGPVSAITSLALLVPSLTVTVRRLHDTNRSGWWLLLVLVPLFGWTVLLVFYCLDGTPGPNRYGPDPKSDLRDIFA